MTHANNSDHFSTCTQSEDDTVIIDPGRSTTMSTPEEAERTVRDFVRYTALYVVMSVSLGTSKDSGNLRQDMRHIRRQAYEFARQGKTNLVPWMIAAHSDSSVQKVLERVFFVFCSCLECFCSHLVRTCELLSEFSTLTTENSRPLQIITGVQDIRPSLTYLRSMSINGNTFQRDSRQNSLLNLRTSRKLSINTSSTFCEREDVECLQREIQSVRDIICEIHTSVAINAWAIGHETTAASVANNSELSLNSSSLMEEVVNQNPFDPVVQDQQLQFRSNNRHVTVSVSHRRRRVLCIVIVVLVSLALLAIVLGLSITLLT